MKKTALVLFMAVLILLGGCAGGQSKTFFVERDGESYLVDTESQVIVDGGYVYQYSIDQDGGTTITYPNGSTYYHISVGGMSASDASDDYDDSVYVSGDILVEIVSGIAAPKSILVALMIVVAGVFTIVSPKVSGFWGGLLGDRKRESSAGMQLVSRISGVVIIVMAIAYLLF